MILSILQNNLIDEFSTRDASPCVKNTFAAVNDLVDHGASAAIASHLQTLHRKRIFLLTNCGGKVKAVKRGIGE